MTILKTISFTKERLPGKLKGIKIGQKMTHYPSNPHTNYTQWNWCKDEFAPPLSHMELQTYIKNPAKFKRDLLANLRLYLKFCSETGNQIAKTESLPTDKKLVSFLTLLFLFMSAMDNHYYHYDYYLDLEEYPKSPLGWHYLRLKKIVTKLANNIGKDLEWVEEKLLHLLSKRGHAIIQQLKIHTESNDLKELNESYLAIQIYLQAQQEEEKLFYGRHMNSPVFATGFVLWRKIRKIVKENENLTRNRKELIKVMNGDPIYGTREILVDMDRFFSKQIVKTVRDEIKNW